MTRDRVYSRVAAMIAVCALCLAGLHDAAYAQDAHGDQLVGQTRLEKVVGKCLTSLLLGAATGAAIGAATGNKVGQGALLGAGVGAGICAYVAILSSKEQKDAVRQAQLTALNSGETQTVEFQTEDGNAFYSQVTAGPITNVTSSTLPGPIACRRIQTSVGTTDGAETYNDVACLKDNAWTTGGDLKAMGIKGSDVQAG